MGIAAGDLKEIRDRIEKAGRPLVFYDDDADGLTSYFLVRKFNPNAIGVRVARGPELTLEYLHKVEENMPDLILILDKPRVEKEFFEKVKTPSIWIDHHGFDQGQNEWKFKHLSYYNPRIKKNSDSRPVSYWMWKITKGPLWIAAIGTLADWHDDLLQKFADEYPKYAPKKLTVKEGLYNSKLGELVRIFNFLLKGHAIQVGKNINALFKMESPEEILDRETSRSKYIYKHYLPIVEEYQNQSREAMKTKVVKGIYSHIYGRVKISLVAEVANEMLLKKNAKIVIVGRRDDGRVKFSMRSHKVDLVPIINAALEGIHGYGGGHAEACGGSVVETEWEDFLEQLKQQI